MYAAAYHHATVVYKKVLIIHLSLSHPILYRHAHRYTLRRLQHHDEMRCRQQQLQRLVSHSILFFSSLTLRAFRLEVIALCHATVGLPPAVVSADDGKPLGETIFLK